MPDEGSRAGALTVTRRDFLRASGALVAGLSTGLRAASADEKPIARFGIVTDPHYADAPARGSRHYRESIPKMTECVTLMTKMKVDFLVELGDFKDQGTPPTEATTLKYLDTIEAVFAGFGGPRYHVLGNHDMDSVSKAQFLARATNTRIARGSSYYSFDSGGLHAVVLDANYRSDGADYDHGNFRWTDANIPQKEREWLARDLAATLRPVVAFIHQQLDGTDSHCVKRSAEVRRILESSNKVLAVLQGHNHAGGHRHIDGIHYYTLKAMVQGSGEKSSSYAIVELYGDRSIAVTGYRTALSRKMAGA